MANIFQQTPVYITAQDVIDSTSKPALAALTVAEIDVLITKAQREVDSYICRTFRPPVEEDQDFLFPVIKDEVSYLPKEITEATLYVVEQVFASGDTVGMTPWYIVKSEKSWPDSVSFDRATNAEFGSLVPDIARKLLEKFKNRFAGQRLDSKDLYDYRYYDTP